MNSAGERRSHGCSRPRLLAYTAHALAERRATDPARIAYAFHIPGDHR